MLESLINIDQSLFREMNGAWSNSFFDQVLPWFRNKYFWAPLYLFALTFLFFNFDRKTVLTVVVLAILSIVASDQISSSLIKPLVGRLRPCNDPDFLDQVILLVDCGSGKSFTSSHATNHFALAFFFGVFFRSLQPALLPVLIFWAAMVSYAQIYVGVHYPFDILGGAILGAFIGIAFAAIGKYILRNKFKTAKDGV
ncbi:MAG: phosphatase PAP2 family protein [Chitinophagales bacterium]